MVLAVKLMGVANVHMMLATPTQVDYYAVAATLYCLIHGNYMEVLEQGISFLGTHQSE